LSTRTSRISLSRYVTAYSIVSSISSRVLQTQRYVRVYDLAAQQLLRTLMPGLKWISSMDVHPSGDHLIVGGYDRKLCWFDLELSEKPYKVLRCVLRSPFPQFTSD
jgi:hypothetical protein